ncbi:citrate synthase [Arthrobacter pigmenti]|uniref:Citrate synthase n=1 Tax=Arthrobacter pigmenti TaxID=271432 RepID=A0A846RQP8_9MICC|nr:citrate synthase [Arthrobacter pigmenti]NJC21426.1 citrate synthase [Arthrobacter pigmenti]
MLTAARTDNTLIDVPRGLANVVVAETKLGEVRGQEGFYTYRQYSAVELARTRSVEEVWCLLLRGSLPDGTGVADLRQAATGLSSAVREALPVIALAGSGDPLAGVRTALSLEGAATGVRPLYDLSPEEREEELIRLAYAVPVLNAALYRGRAGRDPIEPDPALGYAANYLWMVNGTLPTEQQADALNAYLVAALDHGFNASTFAARVIASTGADAASCLVGALGALSGPLHGGAPGRVLEMLDEIGSEEKIDSWIAGQIRAGRRIMGFGHPVYRTEDPRSRLLKEIAVRLGGPRVEFALSVEERIHVLLEELKPGRQLHTNLEFYTAVMMEAIGLDRALFTPTFAAARVLGWTANILEQSADPKIIRPSARYVGPKAPVPVP